MNPYLTRGGKLSSPIALTMTSCCSGVKNVEAFMTTFSELDRMCYLVPSRASKYGLTSNFVKEAIRLLENCLINVLYARQASLKLFLATAISFSVPSSSTCRSGNSGSFQLRIPLHHNHEP
jgi:hypothetical protein